MKNKRFIKILVIFLAVISIFSGCNSTPKDKNNSSSSNQNSLKNTVVFLTFQEEGSNFPNGFKDDIFKMYESTAHSVKNYLLKQSKQKLLLQTQIINSKSGEFIKSDKSVDYYKPRYRWINGSYQDINPQGYDNRYFNKNGEDVAPKSQDSLPLLDGLYREQLLIREILSKLDISTDYNGDLSGDGKLDSLVIISDCDATGDWGDVLWPHAGKVYDFSSVVFGGYYDSISDYKGLEKAELGGASVSHYNMLTASGITAKRADENCAVLSEEEKNLYNIGLLTHETVHLLGLADYYSYEDASYESVGEFDVMGNSYSIPQNMLAYTRLKLGWLDYSNILYVTESGSYTLPLSMEEGQVAVKIVLSNYLQTGEYFMAEVRSGSLATAQSAFDGGLSGDGLIIYRVAPENAFINAKGLSTSIDMGNMYGKDEVYVFRVGNPKTSKKLSAPFNVFSYAMLANGKDCFTLDGGYYTLDSYGNKDKSKNVTNLLNGKDFPSETAISYSNGENSGILFKDVTVNKAAKTVTFTVEIPEDESEGALNSNNVALKRLPNGKYEVRWKGGNNYEEAYAMAIRSTNRLGRKAQKGSLKMQAEDFENGKLGLYKVLEVNSSPIAERSITFRELESEAEIFLCVKNADGEYDYVYVGTALDGEFSFYEYLAKIFDPVYLIVLVAVVILAILIPLAIMLLKNRVKSKK